MAKKLTRAKSTITKKLISRKSIKFDYIKTNSYRNYHVDGLFGGLTPNGYIHMDLFVERNPIPNWVEQDLQELGIPGKEIKRNITTEGIIRQIECGLIVDIKTAVAIRDWLNNKINDFQSTFPEQHYVK